jgi:hypothetical protein
MSRPARTARIPIGELVDLEALAERDGRAPSPRRIREALPRGWVLEEDGLHARRDLRLFFREGWLLLLSLAVFGALGAAFLLGGLPRGWSGLLRVIVLALLIVLAGGIAGPLVTRAILARRR